ncbi:MAG: hypothetical protein KBA55_01265 [Ruminococcus sp.]|nr:hypothetical protein [Ruminococcus sp.]
MEFEKHFGNFTVGGGTLKTAGKGDISVAEKVPKHIRTKHDPKEIAVSAVKAAAVTGLVLLKFKSDKKKKHRD